MTRSTKRLSMNSMDELPAFPEGWYFVASRESILREKLIEKTWLGEEIVAWCDEAGRVCVADAVCPHLGSYLGPEVGEVGASSLELRRTHQQFVFGAGEQLDPQAALRASLTHRGGIRLFCDLDRRANRRGRGPLQRHRKPP